jgi:hypothetical protein
MSIWETHLSLSSVERVWLPFFTAATARCSEVSSPVSIQHDTQFATYQQRKPRIFKLWATVARIRLASRWLWWVSNVPPFTVPRTRAIISRCAESASRTAGKSYSKSANIFPLDFSTSISFWRTSETLHKLPDKNIPAASGTMENRHRRDCGLAPTSAKTKSPSLNLFSLLYPQTQKIKSRFP